jgi:hypothetical protein
MSDLNWKCSYLGLLTYFLTYLRLWCHWTKYSSESKSSSRRLKIMLCRCTSWHYGSQTLEVLWDGKVPCKLWGYEEVHASFAWAFDLQSDWPHSKEEWTHLWRNGASCLGKLVQRSTLLIWCHENGVCQVCFLRQTPHAICYGGCSENLAQLLS